MIGEMQDKGIDVTIFFYNPNIHPRREYVIRKEENKRYAAELGIDFVDADYDTAEWHARAEGMELDPERGARCSMCFDMRMERTIQYAARHGFGAVATTNATSRWKSAAQVDEAGVRAAARFAEAAEARGDTRPPPVYWLYDWQTDAMTLRKYEISAEQRFYKQEYCGCVHSLRDSNAHRAREGLPPVRIGGETAGVGTRYFEDAEADAAEESQEVVDAFFRDAAGGGLLNERAREQFHQRLDARNVPTW